MRVVWSEAAAVARADQKRSDSRRGARAAVFRQLIGREPTDDAELEAFAAIQARGFTPTASGLRRELAQRQRRIVKAMVAGANSMRRR